MVRKAPHWRAQAVDKKLTRDALSREQDGLCFYCRSFMGQSVTIDHVHPKSRGGADTRWNKKAACERCNKAKGSIPHGRFQRAIRNRYPPDDFELFAVWACRKLSLRTERAVKRIRVFMGMEAA